MQASETKIQPIIEGTKQYLVPLFQRPYTWDKKQWQQLWDDLLALYNTETGYSHFFGSIVTMQAISVPEGVAKYLLIDGQQRLTTVFILLIVLRDKARQQNESKLGEQIHNTMLVNQYEDSDDRYKLQPTHSNTDRISFRKLIDRDRITDIASGDDTILRAYKFFDRKLSALNNELTISQLKKTIESKLSVVRILLDANEDPYMVFESLNAKGEPLNQADLIRNHFMMKLHTNQQEAIYKEFWKPMEDALQDKLTECIRHYLMKDGKFVTQREVYAALKKRIEVTGSFECLKELAQFAGYYKKLIDPSSEQNFSIRKWLVRLNRIEVTTAYTFLLNCYSDYAKSILKAEEFSKILHVLENFLVRRFVSNKPTNALNKIFPSLYSQAKDKPEVSFIEAIKLILQTKGYPEDSEFKTDFIEREAYSSQGNYNDRTKLILEAFEENFGHKEQVSFDRLTIEHIMPQTLDKNWELHLGDDFEETFPRYLHKIGNLTLTAPEYNSQLSNNNFYTKQSLLNQSHLEINKYFTRVTTWGREEIIERSEYLANIALKVWPYFGKTEKILGVKLEGVTGTKPTALWILGEKFQVQHWSDIFKYTVNTIAELEPEKFAFLANKFPSYIGKDQMRFRSPVKLKNGHFIETSLQANANTIYKLCKNMLNSIDLTDEDWQIENQ
jgi:uncharacterized protein with ParB-like and HNH nuclease domain